MLGGKEDRLTGCIGCGCLSLKLCQLMNPTTSSAARARDLGTYDSRDEPRTWIGFGIAVDAEENPW
jgi:hypothetical protein